MQRNKQLQDDKRNWSRIVTHLSNIFAILTCFFYCPKMSNLKNAKITFFEIKSEISNIVESKLLGKVTFYKRKVIEL